MDDKFLDMFVRKVLYLCEKQGLTIYQLSKVSGVSYSTLRRIISKRVSTIKLKTVIKLTDGFSMSLLEFYNLEVPD